MKRNKLGQFVKGHEPYNYWLGKKRDLATGRKISKVLKGRLLPVETRLKMSLARKGKSQWWHKGVPLSEEHKKKIGRKGAVHWNWQGGLSLINDRHDSTQYKEWRKEVYKKDNYTCQICGTRKEGKNKIILNADHIKQWALYPELRYEISNGRTLCVECHRMTPTFGGKLRVVKEVVPYDWKTS